MSSNRNRSIPTAAIVAAALVVGSAGPAGAQNPGDEYLPQIPSATGDQPVGPAGGSGGGSGPTGTGDTGAPVPKDGKGKPGSSTGEGPPSLRPPSDRNLSVASSGEDSSGLLDTLLNPIVLLLIFGVPAIAVGMILARRQGDRGSGDRGRRAGQAPPPTPDGEIVGPS